MTSRATGVIRLRVHHVNRPPRFIIVITTIQQVTIVVHVVVVVVLATVLVVPNNITTPSSNNKHSNHNGSFQALPRLKTETCHCGRGQRWDLPRPRYRPPPPPPPVPSVPPITPPATTTTAQQPLLMLSLRSCHRPSSSRKTGKVLSLDYPVWYAMWWGSIRRQKYYRQILYQPICI